MNCKKVWLLGLILGFLLTMAAQAQPIVYTASPTVFAYTSFSPTFIRLGDDEISGPIPLPFGFRFYGTLYTTIYIESDGFLTFLPGQPASFSPQRFPNPAPPNGMIAAYWEDLDAGVGGTISYGTAGTAPSRIFIVEFNSVPHFSPRGAFPVSFQVKLFEGSNIIEIHARSCPSNGNPHTQGIKNQTGTQAAFLSGRNLANFSLTNDAVRFVSGPAPPSFDPPTPTRNFSINPGRPFSFDVRASSGDSTVLLSVSGLPTGATFPIPPRAATVTSTFRWTPTAAQLGRYTVTFTATDARGTSNRRDIGIEVAADRPPQFTTPPTPPVGQVYNIQTADTVTFTVEAFDPDADSGDTVLLGVTGLPTGATFPIPPRGSPVSSTFNWQPTGSQTGRFTLTLTATDTTGLQATRAITINVSRGPEVVEPATVRIWDVEPLIGDNPDQTVEDPNGLTGHVATPTNPLTLVTVWENTTHPGGPCGVTYWNPATNAFKWYGVGGGFQASVDMNRTGPVTTGPGGATFRPGDIWAGIPGGSTAHGSHAHGSGEGPLWMNFRNSDRMRSYNVTSVWGIHIASDGQVWFGEYGASALSRLNPATNVLTRWAVGGGTGFVAIDSSGRVYVTAAGTQQVVRVDPRTNEVVRWPTPGAFTRIPAGFETPNGIDIDAEGNVWFVESALNRYGRINITTNEFCEYTRREINQPQLIATTGAAATLQAFATEYSSAIDVITNVRARSFASCRTITPLSSTLAPTTATVGFFDFTISPLRATITPRTVTVPGSEMNGIARFPVGTHLGSLSGQTGVVGASTLFGSDLANTHVYEFRSSLVLTPDQPPVFDSPPTPISRQTVQVGSTLTFEVQATDPDPGDVVTLGVSGLPPRATFPIPAPARTVRGRFTWTPTAAEIGSRTVTFTARETSGLSAPPRAIEIVVSAAPVDTRPPVFIAPTPPSDPPLTADVGSPITFTVRASDPDEGDIVTLFATGLPAGASFVPGDPANPVSGAFTWTPISSDVGSHPVNFIAQDRAGNATTRRITIMVTRAAREAGCRIPHFSRTITAPVNSQSQTFSPYNTIAGIGTGRIGFPTHFFFDGTFYYSLDGGGPRSTLAKYNRTTGAVLDSAILPLDGRTLTRGMVAGELCLKGFSTGRTPGARDNFDTMNRSDLSPLGGGFRMLYDRFTGDNDSDAVMAGAFLYSFRDNTIRKHDMTTGAVLETISLAPALPSTRHFDQRSFDSDGNFFFFFDSTRGNAHVYDLRGNQVEVIRIPLPGSIRDGVSVSFADGKYWLYVDGIARWVCYDLGVAPPPNRPPVFDTPPTPPGTSTLIANVGFPFTFTVQASDPDEGDTVTLDVSGLPTGATFPIPSAANPVRSTFRWTPTRAQLGAHGVLFTARDALGASVSRMIPIEVRESDTTPPECTVDILDGPPRAVQVTVRDRESGLDRINVLLADNVRYTIPTFTRGTTDPVLITAVKVDAALPSHFQIEIFDVAGNRTECDPLSFRISAEDPVAEVEFKTKSLEEKNFILQLSNAGTEYLHVWINDTYEQEFFAVDDTLIDWQGAPICSKENGCTVPLYGPLLKLDITDYLIDGANVIYVESSGPEGTFADMDIVDMAKPEPTEEGVKQ